MKQCILSFFIVLGWQCINKPLNAANILYFTSAPRNWIGQGQTVTLTSPATTFSAFRYFDYGAYTNVVKLDTGSYTLRLVGPEHTLPTVGFYSNATRLPFMGSGVGMAFVGMGRANNTLTGYFNVLQADYDINGQIASFAVDFTQYDEGETSRWLSGSFRYNSDVPIPEPCTLLLLGLGVVLIRKR